MGWGGGGGGGVVDRYMSRRKVAVIQFTQNVRKSLLRHFDSLL